MNSNLFALCKTLGELCVSRQKRIALAESCTGGKISALITDISGSGAWFNGSIVAYNNPAKIHLLSVDPLLIKTHGAVSEPVAQAMAKGVLEKFEADFSVSVTGIAGPTGSTAKKSVGLVCFALTDKEGYCQSKSLHFTSGREYIRRCAATTAIEWMIAYLSV